MGEVAEEAPDDVHQALIAIGVGDGSGRLHLSATVTDLESDRGGCAVKVVGGETIVQVVETAADTAYPIVANPDIWWIVGTAAACAVEIAGLTMVGAKVISVFAKADKLIKSTKSIVGAYNALGGKFDKVMSLVKKYVKNKSSLSKKQVKALEKFIKAVGITVFGWLGLGSCYDLVTTKY